MNAPLSSVSRGRSEVRVLNKDCPLHPRCSTERVCEHQFWVFRELLVCMFLSVVPVSLDLGPRA